MSFSSDEVNFLVYRYLQESGKANGSMFIFPVSYKDIINISPLVCLCRLPAFCLHIWHWIAHISVQHQWGSRSPSSSPLHHTKRTSVHWGWDQCWRCIDFIINIILYSFLINQGIVAFQDGAERPMESLSLIDAVMPDVVASRQQQLQNNQKPQVVKTEPPNSNGDEPMHSYCKPFLFFSMAFFIDNATS